MHRERKLVAALIVCKLLFLVWNAAVFDGEIYDQAHHLWRLSAAGFNRGKMAYNGPLYYLPTAPYLLLAQLGVVAEVSSKQGGQHLMQLMRFVNVGWLAVFYGSWIYGVFPKVTPDERTWFAASLVLLSLPGYQKVGTLVHPDNMLAAMSAAGIALWLLTRERASSPLRTRWEWALALLTGLLGSVRPFAVVPVVVLWGALMWSARKGRTLKVWLQRGLLYTLLSAVLASAWLGFRAYDSRVVLDAYKTTYIEEFQAHRSDFDFIPYFTTFYYRELLQRPNRQIKRLDRSHPKWENIYGNSFFTIAYSEFWGDHWLYLSGPRLHEQKKLEKRRLLQVALPLSVLLIGRFFWGVGLLFTRVGKSLRDRVLTPAVEAQLVLLGMLVAGLALYMYWQTGPGLLPGKNSTIKFLYNAHLVPLAIAIAFVPRVRWPWLWGVMALIVTAVSIPFLLFRPRWL